ncbi:MAG: fatty acid desaturase [Phycisphaeraceae bacterium]|nr:fatty acid desaturase [Phycisphaeraceae bacterium]MCW5754269.1 fatty acid desaturase [Phycisphaeraceae bacterium]
MTEVPSKLVDLGHADGHPPMPRTWPARIANILGVVTPLAGVIVATILLWGVAFNWVYLVLLAGMYLATGFGITVGYHRLFTHKSFDTPRPVAFIIGALGSMAAQGSILQWAGMHRQHHQHSDGEHDPHTPHASGDGVLGVLRGLWHAHVGWIVSRGKRVQDRYITDLRQDRIVRVHSRLFPVWVVVGLALPAVLGGLLTLSWLGVLLGFLWAGLVRIFLVHHVTWSVNSVCHFWGTRPFRSHDESRNNVIFGILALGEGWHNNHHAFPTSARHGLRWWQIDLSYLLIRGLALVGLARNVRTPSPERLAAKRSS